MTTPRERLEEKRAALPEAEATLAAASAAFDEEAVIAAHSRVETLRGFVDALEAEAERENKGYCCEEAERLAKERVRDYRDRLGTPDADATAAREVIRKALAETGKIYARWNTAAKAPREIELLMLRYPDLRNGTQLPPPPKPPNVAAEWPTSTLRDTDPGLTTAGGVEGQKWNATRPPTVP